MPAYFIMTADGWKPLPITVSISMDTMRNPFRSWEKEGAKSYQDWIAR